MIDFPSSPTVGQLYTAPNGVTYQWNGTLWLTNSAGGSGAVQAASGNFVPVTGTDVVIVFASIVSGNSGNWLNTVNGRYTPPPGRYFIQCTNGVQAPAGGNGTWALVPRKNGVRIPNEGANASGGPQFSIPITVGIYVDANGTDYFDWVANCASANMAAQGGQFTAFPLSGLQGPPGPLPTVGGDFCAYSTNIGLATGTAVAIPTTILSGNSGNWYNPATGRYTPPAGRYVIRASMFAPNTSSAVGLGVNIRKNGQPLPTAWAGTAAGNGGGQVPGSAGWWADPNQEVIVDANGTDYFDFVTYCGTGQYTTIQFMAFPITGVQGPAGPGGVISNGYRLISRVVPNGSSSVIDFNAIPADINDIEVRFDLVPTTNDDSLRAQFYLGGALVTAGYSWANTLNQHNAAVNAAAMQSSSVGVGVTSAIFLNFSATGNNVANYATAGAGIGGIKGRLNITNIRDATRVKSLDFRSQYFNGAGTAINFVTGAGGGWSVGGVGALTGLRLLFGSAANMAAVGAASLWGSP